LNFCFKDTKKAAATAELKTY